MTTISVLVTAVIAAALVLLVVLAVRSLIRRKKSGRYLSCGGDCSVCPMAPYEKDKERRKILEEFRRRSAAKASETHSDSDH